MTKNKNVVEMKVNEEIIKINIDEKSYKTSEMKKFEICPSKSECFRKLYDLGIEISEISKMFDSHYSFVYGVISNSREVRKVIKESKSDIIRKLHDDGLKVGEIAKQLNSNYSFVFTVCKKYKLSKVEKVVEK